MGSHIIGSGSAPDFSITWNSAEAMDGVSAIQATARDVLGNQLALTECVVQVSNRHASLAVNAPDLSQTLSGALDFSVTGSDTEAFPAVWTLNVDGEQQSIVWTDNTWKSPLTILLHLDTTRFSNGPHELHISMNSRTGPNSPQWVNWRGMVNRVITVNNGHAWMDIVPGFQSLYMKPGDTIALGCARLFTDGKSDSCGSVVYESGDASVAAVDGAGIITAAQMGFTQITLRDGIRSATARVWVAAGQRIPHFTGNGEMRQGYEAGKSLFIIAPFFLDPDLLRRNVVSKEDVERAGVNTLGHGVYLNPRDNTVAFSAWKASFDQTIAPKINWARDNGFHLLLTGDDIFRRIGGDAWFTLNWKYGDQAVQYAVRTLAASGVGIGIEAIDEASSIWGERPVPLGRIGAASYLFDRIDCTSGSCFVNWPGNPLPSSWNFALAGSSSPLLNTPSGSLFATQNSTSDGFHFQSASSVNGAYAAATDPGLEYLWFAGNYCTNGTPCIPEVPNDALASMRKWMQVSPIAVPVSFPPLAVAPPGVHGNWMGPGGLSDYASNYFSSLKTRTTYPWSEGIQEMVSSMTQSFVGRQPYLMLDRPQLMLVSLAGPSYTKGDSGMAIYQAGVDSLDEPGVSPEHVSALMMHAAALGCAGLRLYFFESPANFNSRANAPAGATFQTGANPSNLRVASWQAMGYAATLLTKVLEPYLLNTALNSPTYGRNITTAGREGVDGRLLLIVNGNDWPRTIAVDFQPYPHAFGITRYRLRATGITAGALAATLSGDSVTLAAGETVAYIFPRSTATGASY